MWRIVPRKAFAGHDFSVSFLAHLAPVGRLIIHRCNQTEERYVKNLLLIAFATLALSMGANIANACPACEGKTTVKAEKKADKAEVKKTDKAATDVNTDAVKDTKEVKTATAGGCGGAKKASAGQAVKADRDTANSCKNAGEGCGSGCGGCGSAKADTNVKADSKEVKADTKSEGCGSGCGGCATKTDSTTKADTKSEGCEGCGSAKKAEKVVKN